MAKLNGIVMHFLMGFVLQLIPWGRWQGHALWGSLYSTIPRSDFISASTLPHRDGGIARGSTGVFDEASTNLSEHESDWDYVQEGAGELGEASTALSEDGSDWGYAQGSAGALDEASMTLSADRSSWGHAQDSAGVLDEAITNSSKHESGWDYSQDSACALESDWDYAQEEDKVFFAPLYARGNEYDALGKLPDFEKDLKVHRGKPNENSVPNPYWDEKAVKESMAAFESRLTSTLSESELERLKTCPQWGTPEFRLQWYLEERAHDLSATIYLKRKKDMMARWSGGSLTKSQDLLQEWWAAFSAGVFELQLAYIKNVSERRKKTPKEDREMWAPPPTQDEIAPELIDKRIRLEDLTLTDSRAPDPREDTNHAEGHGKWDDLHRDSDFSFSKPEIKEWDLKKAGPILTLLPAVKLSVITVHQTLSMLMASSGRGSFTSLAMRVGRAVQAEIGLDRLRRDIKDSGSPENLVFHQNQKRVTKSEQRGLIRAVNIGLEQRYPDHRFSPELTVVVGAVLIKLLIQRATVNDETLTQQVPAFEHTIEYIPKTNTRKGMVKLQPTVMAMIFKTEGSLAMCSRHLPMITPPLPWKREFEGCYLKPIGGIQFVRKHYDGKEDSDLDSVNDPFNKGALFEFKNRGLSSETGNENDDAAPSAFRNFATSGERSEGFGYVPHALDVLSATPWKINLRVFAVVQEAVKRGMAIAELPPQQDIDVTELQRRLNEEKDPSKRKATLIELRRTEQKNRDLHSLRCSLINQLHVAGLLAGAQEFYFPHNVDFRGRAYPIPPHLNHLGSDICRGLLKFAQAKPLGPRGLYWLKVHLANLFGENKKTFDDRVAWVNGHLPEVYAVAADALADNSLAFWLKADDPWQALATCFEIDAANASGLGDAYLSDIPVHQDGSCNGLQHYAALGLDEIGAAQVNLIPLERPGDPYTEVCNTVNARIALDCADPERQHHKIALIMSGKVHRKIVKQTVMTTVYGVTFVGARDQIEARLREEYGESGSGTLSKEDVQAGSQYLAHITLESVGEIFQGASTTMAWLRQVAKRVVEQGKPIVWETPLGLRVEQPYLAEKKCEVQTCVQRVTLRLADPENDRIKKQKQITAFPPNFVHSLDSTHLLRTAVKFSERGGVFAGVHDSYWTHACDCDVLAQVLREEFVTLYSEPVLSQLKVRAKASSAPLFTNNLAACVSVSSLSPSSVWTLMYLSCGIL